MIQAWIYRPARGPRAASSCRQRAGRGQSGAQEGANGALGVWGFVGEREKGREPLGYAAGGGGVRVGARRGQGRNGWSVGVIAAGPAVPYHCPPGVWCNGSTTDSDSVSLGSNPSTPTFRFVCRAVRARAPPGAGAIGRGHHFFKSILFRTPRGVLWHQFARLMTAAAYCPASEPVQTRTWRSEAARDRVGPA